MIEPKFPELPVDVQVALINAATQMATAKIQSQGSRYNQDLDFFKREYQKICDALYTENRGRYHRSPLMERNMDESRKQFEEWFMEDVVGAAVDFPEFEDGEYVAGEVYDEQLYVMLQAMYMAWTASRSAIEIELPMPKYTWRSDDYSQGFDKGLAEQRKNDTEAIRAAGIKVKE